MFTEVRRTICKQSENFNRHRKKLESTKQKTELKNTITTLINSVEGSAANCVICSVMSDSTTPWTVVHQAPLSMEFSRQEYWSEQPFPSPGDLPDPRIEPRSPALQADSLPSEPPGKPRKLE